MKTIIIPVKFNFSSANLLQNVVPICGEEETNVILLEVRETPDAYSDLLTLPKVSMPKNIVDAYKKHAALLNTTYHTNISVSADFLYGDSPAVFRNYVQFKECDLVIYSENEWQHTSKSMNIFRMTKRCGCEMIYIASEVAMPKEEPATYTLNKQAILDNQTEAPDTVFQSYNAVDQLLNELHDYYFENKIISKKVSNLSRYFLKEASLQDLLQKSNCSMVLIKS